MFCNLEEAVLLLQDLHLPAYTASAAVTERLLQPAGEPCDIHEQARCGPGVMQDTAPCGPGGWTASAAAAALASLASIAVVTDGCRGAVVAALGEVAVVPPHWAAKGPVDVCGAGDAYAGGIVYAIAQVGAALDSSMQRTAAFAQPFKHLPSHPRLPDEAAQAMQWTYCHPQPPLLPASAPLSPSTHVYLTHPCLLSSLSCRAMM